MQMRTNMMGRLAGAGIALLCSTCIANAAEVKVLTAGALQVAMRSLAADFEKQTGNHVTIKPTNPALVEKELAAANYDVIAAATPTIAEFDESGRLQAGTRNVIARTGIGIAIKQGAPKPDVSTVTAFKKAVHDAKSIVYSDPSTPNASGPNTQHILTNAGLLDEVKKKGKQEGLAQGREAIARGEFEMGFFNVSEAGAPGVELAGPVPAPLQQYINYDAAVLRSAPDKDAGAAFVKFISSRAAGANWKAAGLDQLNPH
jgi:molybdate transport system substrate-binding protein